MCVCVWCTGVCVSVCVCCDAPTRHALIDIIYTLGLLAISCMCMRACVCVYARIPHPYTHATILLALTSKYAHVRHLVGAVGILDHIQALGGDGGSGGPGVGTKCVCEYVCFLCGVGWGGALF